MDDVPPILVVEDEVLIRLSMTEALEQGGYAVIEASTGDEAISRIVEVQQLRAIVTDIRIGPGPDGWEVAQRAREKFSSLPVVYATADSASDWPVKGVPLSTLLHKPFASAELVAAVANKLVSNNPTGDGS